MTSIKVRGGKTVVHNIRGGDHRRVATWFWTGGGIDEKGMSHG